MRSINKMISLLSPCVNCHSQLTRPISLIYSPQAKNIIIVQLVQVVRIYWIVLSYLFYCLCLTIISYFFSHWWLTVETVRPRNDLSCVWWGIVKLYSLTHRGRCYTCTVGIGIVSLPRRVS